jgi:hypothetical protein
MSEIELTEAAGAWWSPVLGVLILIGFCVVVWGRHASPTRPPRLPPWQGPPPRPAQRTPRPPPLPRSKEPPLTASLKPALPAGTIRSQDIDADFSDFVAGRTVTQRLVVAVIQVGAIASGNQEKGRVNTNKYETIHAVEIP